MLVEPSLGHSLARPSGPGSSSFSPIPTQHHQKIRALIGKENDPDIGGSAQLLSDCPAEYVSFLFLPSAPKEAAPGDPGPSSITFFAFSLIEGYISIVMDAETQKKYVTPDPRWVTAPKPGTGRKEVEHQTLRSPGPPPSPRFPSNLLLTSSSGELWRMVRIGGQPLGFGEGRSLCVGDLGRACGATRVIHMDPSSTLR